MNNSRQELIVFPWGKCAAGEREKVKQAKGGADRKEKPEGGRRDKHS